MLYNEADAFAISDEVHSECGGLSQSPASNNYEELCQIVLFRCIFLLTAVKGPDKPWPEDEQTSDDEADKVLMRSEDCYR